MSDMIVTKPVVLDFENMMREMMCLSARSGRVLSRDDAGGMRTVARLCFAELVLELGSGLVRECVVPSGDQDDVSYCYEPGMMPMSVTLCSAEAERMDAGRIEVVRRMMEHSVALGALAWIYSGEDADVCRHLQQQRSEVTGRLREQLEGLPTVVAGWP